MDIAAPVVKLRRPSYGEMSRCCDLVMNNWGEDAAARCQEQFMECWKGGSYAPRFVAAVDGKDEVIGFGAVHRSMQCTFNIIWLVVAPNWQGCNVGRQLVERMLEHVDDSDGMLVEVITQEKGFYQKLGFYQVHHLGQEWYLMLKPVGEFGL